MQGKIMKGIAGFYYVHVEGAGVYECKAKGIFRKERVKPLVGDDVEIAVLDEGERLGSISGILPRKSELLRPAVANVDQALLFFSLAKPEPNLNLLDRFLIRMERQGLPAILCFNKDDIAPPAAKEDLREIYGGCGCPLLFVSVGEKRGMERLRELLAGKTTALAGPSGVGKSSLINLLAGALRMETGELSEKIARGKHTTRHSEIIPLGDFVAGGGYLMDTPGFTSLELPEMDVGELAEYYPEFRAFAPFCRFRGCVHKNEPDCRVKAAVEEGAVSRVRYENYSALYEELRESGRRRR